MTQLKIPLGQQEYLLQLADKKLYYAKVAFYASQMNMVMASDRLAPTPGGVRYSGFSSEILHKFPLDQYEKSVAGQARYERLVITGSGRVEESSIIFDALLFVATWGGSSVAARAFSTLSLVGNIASAASSASSLQGSVQDEFVKTLWKATVRKFALLNNDWVVELVTAGTGKIIGQLGSNTKKQLTPSEVILQKIQSFRFAVDPPAFHLKLNQLKLQAAAPKR